MNVTQAVARCKVLQKRIKSYQHAMWLLQFDRSTVAPRAGAAYCGETVGMLAGDLHNTLCGIEMAELLALLGEHEGELDAQTRAEVELLRLQIAQNAHIPAAELEHFEGLCGGAGAAWEQAKRTNDFASYQPHFAALLAQARKMGTHAQWLDKHEMGSTIESLDAFFAPLQETLPPLIRAVSAKSAEVDDSCLWGNFPIDKQRALSDYLMDVFCIDRSRCILAESEHPFTSDYSNRDVRITTHYYPDNFKSAMYATIHEMGHGLSYLLTEDRHNYSILYGMPSGGTAEGQSRFQENMVGRDEGFLAFLLPKLHELFPEQLKGINARKLYLALHKSAPSLIRIAADELTYSMHILVRYQLEKEMFSGELRAENLPKRWNELYKNYLGIDVPDDTRGCLQDVHWSSGGFGGFVSYALGNAYSVQMRRAICREQDFLSNIARGDMKPHLTWLQNNIYNYGSELRPQKLIEVSTGEPLNVQHYIDYLTDKYSGIYNL